MSMKLLSRYEGYELIIPASTTSNQVNFPDIPELRSDTIQDTVVMSAEVTPQEALPATYSGNTTATMAQIQNSFLTLYILGFQQFYRIPLVKLVQIRNEGAAYYYSGQPFQFKPVRIDWTKSYVSFATPPNNEDQFSFMFTFGYEWLPAGAYESYLTNLNNQLKNGIIPIQ